MKRPVVADVVNLQTGRVTLAATLARAPELSEGGEASHMPPKPFEIRRVTRREQKTARTPEQIAGALTAAFPSAASGVCARVWPWA